MPIALAPVTIGASGTVTVALGGLGTVGAVVIANESPYGVQASAGAGQQWIAAQTLDIMYCNVTGWSGAITLTTNDYLSNAANAPSFVVLLTVYSPGEPIPGTYPSALARLSNSGNLVTVASQVINDGSASGTNVLEATPSGQVDSFALIRNDGTVDIKTLSSSVETDTFHITPGGASPSTIKMDNSKIATDGSGNLTAATLIAGPSSPNNVKLTISPTGTEVDLFVDGNAGPAHLAMILYAMFSGVRTPIVGIGNAGAGSAPAYFDANGVLHVPAPNVLAAGNQETGYCGVQAYTTQTGTTGAIGQGVNYKTVMTNAPSSITLGTPLAHANDGTRTTGFIDAYGFQFVVFPSAANTQTYCFVHYTTVGNCLLAVDVSARTFDHHCDNCGAIRRNLPCDAVTIAYPTPGLVALSLSCPDCDATECFNSALTADDEADASPQGSGEYLTTRGAQATMIRQLMRLLGLAVQ